MSPPDRRRRPPAEDDAAVAAFLVSLVDRDASVNTLEAYAADLRQLVASVGSDWPAVGRADVAVHAARLVALGRKPSSVARKVAVARAFFRWLQSSGRIAQNPLADLRAPPAAPTPTRMLTRAQVTAFVAAPPPSSPAGGQLAATLRRDDALALLLAATGVRASELVALDVDDVALAAAAVRAGRKGRELPLDRSAAEALARYLDDDGRPALVDRRPPTRALFVNAHGQRLTRQGAWAILKGRARRAGLPTWVTTESLRQAFATHLLAERASIDDVAALLGYAQPTRSTLYRHRRLARALAS